MQQTPSKRKYTVTDKVRASGRLNLEKARAVGNKILYRPTDKRVDACRSNLEKARESPNYKPFVRHGLRAVDLRRSAPQVGESQEDLDRHLERVQGVVQAITGRERNAVQGLAQALWRRQRVFTSRVHWETLRFYQEVEKAAVDGLCPASVHDLFRNVSDLFLEGEDPRLEQISECLEQRLERVAQAYLTERAGRKICLGPLGHYRHSEAFLGQPPEAIGNPLVRPGQVVRRLQQKERGEMRPTDEWPWKLKRKDAPSHLLEEWARLGYRLPDPHRPEDFALHLRLLEAAFGLADLRSPIADCPPSLPDQSTIDNHPSAIRAAVGQLAEATWQRLQVFCRQAEKEVSQLRETLEKAEAGTLPRPKTLVEYVKAIRDRHRARDWSATDTAPAPGEGMAAVNETGPVPYVETPGEPEAKWWADHLIWVFIYGEAGRAYQEAAALNRRVDEAFRGLEGAVQKALQDEDRAMAEAEIAD